MKNPLLPKYDSAGVFRGGYWNGITYYLRSAGRTGNSPTDRYAYFGFRIVRSSEKK